MVVVENVLVQIEKIGSILKQICMQSSLLVWMPPRTKGCVVNDGKVVW